MDTIMNNGMVNNMQAAAPMGVASQPVPTAPQTIREAAPIQTVAQSVTTVKDLEKYAQGTIVALPDFAEGQPFVARMRRPSMLALVKQGAIPNSLLVTANELFQDGVGMYDSENKDALSEIFNVVEIIAEASLIQPSYEDIKRAGLQLTDEQLLAIFSYSQQGVSALESFR